MVYESGSVNSEVIDVDKLLAEFPNFIEYIKNVTQGDVRISKPRVEEIGFVI